MTHFSFLHTVSFLLLLFFQLVLAQSPPRKEIDMDKFVQDLFGQQTIEVNYESVYESLFQYYRYPLDINTATKEELENLYLLSPYQISSLLTHRNSTGPIISLYELQSVEGFDRLTIDKILPFVKIAESTMEYGNTSLWQRIKEEENSYAILRYGRTLENQRGFELPDTNRNKFLGSPDRIYGRYRVQHKNDFSIGITADKDAGEPLTWNPTSKQYGFDHYSAHIALYNKGIAKNITIGDYQVMIGQGLVMTAGFYLGKGAETVTTVKRSNKGIKPYSGSMEYGYLRGGAATIKLGNFDWTNFVSYKKLDANSYTLVDSLGQYNTYISSILSSGSHRTMHEIQLKGNQGEAIGGSHLSFSNPAKNLSIGINSVFTTYDIPIQRFSSLYTKYDFQGKENYNIGGDISYHWQNFNFFGEYSHSKGGGNGLVAGFVSSLTPKFDFSMLVRSYDPNFYSFYGNTFGEIATNRNERGIYWGLKYTLSKKLNFAGYFDKFLFPWLTYRSDSPSEGFETMLRMNWTPTKKINLHLQFRHEQKEINKTDNDTQLNYVINTNRQNFLLDLNYVSEKIISLKSRIQFTDYWQENTADEYGMVILQDFNFDFSKKLRISTRLALFDAQDYNTRLYVYEKTTLYAFSMPIYYGQGTRNYIMIQYKINKNIDIWLRLARFDYRNSSSISSGLNQIDGNSKTDVTVQIKYDF